MSIGKAQIEALNDGFIDLNVEDSANYSLVDFSNTQNMLTNLAADYSLRLAQKLKDKDIDSTGDLGESIQPLALQIDGETFYVEIQALEYASYVDEGVDGWANSRGSRFKFKPPNKGQRGNNSGTISPMVKSIQAYLLRSKKATANVKVAVSHREVRGLKVKDASLQEAKTAAYMIKRFGIKATHFWQDATKEFETYLETQLGIAVKVDLINNIIPKK
jgi:hypothetical protein